MTTDALPEPYYRDELVTLYQGDCRALLPLLELAERTVVVTDPPYGIRYTTRTDERAAPWKGAQAWDESDGFDVARELAERFPAACFSTWKLPPPFDARGMLVWHKGTGGVGDCSFPWLPDYEVVYLAGKGWAGRRDTSVQRHVMHTHVGQYSSKTEPRVHPTQKPVSLLEHLIGKCPGHDVIDPFAGSGSTGVAAKRLGRRCTLIEIDPHYCEVAAKRLRGTRHQPSLFEAVGGG